MSTLPTLRLQTKVFPQIRTKEMSACSVTGTQKSKASNWRSLRETQWFPENKLSRVSSFVQITKLIKDQKEHHNIKEQGGVLTIIQVLNLLLQMEKSQTNCLNQQCLVPSDTQSSVKPVKITHTRDSPRNILFLRLFLKYLLRIFGNWL